MFKLKNDLVFICGIHWTLTVFNLDAQLVYHMDSLKWRIINEDGPEWLTSE